ncbi:MAG: hypothetical protein JO108_28320 [Acidobacteriaceae bacterium]|nr:hypothetical protein [Acidobacteriaceae bacterium]
MALLEDGIELKGRFLVPPGCGWRRVSLNRSHRNGTATGRRGLCTREHLARIRLPGFVALERRRRNRARAEMESSIRIHQHLRDNWRFGKASEANPRIAVLFPALAAGNHDAAGNCQSECATYAYGFLHLSSDAWSNWTMQVHAAAPAICGAIPLEEQQSDRLFETY